MSSEEKTILSIATRNTRHFIKTSQLLSNSELLVCFLKTQAAVLLFYRYVQPQTTEKERLPGHC